LLGWAWLHSSKGREAWPAVLRAWLCMAWVGLFFFVWNDSRPLLLQHALAKKQKQKNIYKYITVVHGFLCLLFSIIDFFLFSLVFIFEYLVIKVHFFYYTVLIYSYKLSPKYLVDKCTNDMN